MNSRLIHFTACLGLSLFLAIGCKPAAERQRIARLEEFRKQMDQVDASIVVGMRYSNMVAKIGEPFLSETNNGWTMLIYQYEPHVFHELITNGFRVDVSNGVVIRKFASTGTFK